MNKDIERLKEAVWLKIWQDTYGRGGGDVEAAAMTERLAVDCHEPGDTEAGDAMYAMHNLWGAKWLDSGRIQLVVGHKYAAALMSSAVIENIQEDMILPWKAFAIDLPDGLLSNAGVSFERITVGVYEGLPFGCVMSLWGKRVPATATQGVVQFNRVAADPASLFFAKEAEVVLSDGTARDLDFKERAMQLAIRLTTGALYTMQHTDNFKTRECPAKASPSERRGPPPHRVYVIGKPMGLDCRPAVNHYIAGHKSAPPSVQCIVRGHYKRQVIGIGRAGRKVIWVEPYWRGPEAAPILTRPYLVGQQREATR